MAILKSKKIILAIISILLFIIIVVCLLTNNIYQFDLAVFDLLLKHSNAFFDITLRNITKAGSFIYLVGFCILLILYFRKETWKYLLALNLFNITALSQILKYIFARERPDPLLRDGYSFPSAHTMLAMAFFGFLIYIINAKTTWSKGIKIIISSLLGLLILLVGISRVYLGYHFASDVIAGILIAFAYLLLFTYVISNTSTIQNISKHIKQLLKTKP